jgi:hypothetical protein
MDLLCKVMVLHSCLLMLRGVFILHSGSVVQAVAADIEAESVQHAITFFGNADDSKVISFWDMMFSSSVIQHKHFKIISIEFCETVGCYIPRDHDVSMQRCENLRPLADIVLSSQLLQFLSIMLQHSPDSATLRATCVSRNNFRSFSTLHYMS